MPRKRKRNAALSVKKKSIPRYHLRVLRVLRLRKVFNLSAGAHIVLARFSSRTTSSFVSPAKAMHSAVSSRRLVLLLKWIADTPQSGRSRGFRHGLLVRLTLSRRP